MSRPLSENVAIQIWIARNFPEARLLRADPWQELQAISVLAWCAARMHPPVSRIHPQARVSVFRDAQRQCAKIGHHSALRKLQNCGRYACGAQSYFFDHFIAANAHFFWCFRRGTQFDLDLSEFTNCERHFETMKRRASVQRLLAYEKKIQQ